MAKRIKGTIFGDGFSLPELLIGLAITAVLIVAAFPGLMSLLTSYRLKGGAERIYQALNLAKSEALKTQNSVYFVMNTGTSWCFGVRTGSTCSCNVAGSCTLLSQSATDFANTTLSNSTTDTIIFDGMRGSVTTPGTITLTSGSKSLVISLNSSGVATVCGNNVSGYISC